MMSDAARCSINGTDHPWCFDPSRDEAVRAAEDGRSGPLPTLEECIAGVTERRPPDPRGGGNVTGLRTERVSLSLARMGELIDERDAAIRERDEFRRALTAENDHALRIKAELERIKAELDELKDIIVASESAPAASGAAGTEVVAWAILRGGHFIVATVNEVAANESCKDYGGTVVPLYAAPQPAPGWLTAEERKAVEYFSEFWDENIVPAEWNEMAAKLRSLLARSSPPEVVRPNKTTGHEYRDDQWVRSIIASGAKVKEVGRG